MEIHQQIAIVLRERLWHLHDTVIDEMAAAQVETILRETLEGYYPYDQATGYYWITAEMNGSTDLDPAAMAPFELSVSPLEGMNVSQLRFSLRQVAPFRLFDEVSSEVADDGSRAVDHIGRDAADGDYAGDGVGTGAVHNYVGPDAPVAGEQVRSVRVPAEVPAKLQAKPTRRFPILD